MRPTCLRAILLFAAAGLAAAAPPNRIPYQGTLRENGAPVNGSRQFRFRITDASGGTIYWDSGPMAVTVANGLVRVNLEPTGVAWESVSPYLEVSVEGTTLLPREPIGSAPYSLVAASASFAQNAGFAANAGNGIPSGMIAMFDGSSCPSGWTEVTSLRNRFPLGWDGATIAGDSNTGGTDTHTHTLTIGISNGQTQRYAAGSEWAAHPDHNHGGSSLGSTTVLPPFRRVIFCRKN